MKIVFAPTHLAVRNGIPELRKKYPDLNFVYCSSREEIPDLIVDADVFVGGLNRDLYLRAKQTKMDSVYKLWSGLFHRYTGISG